MTDDQSTDQQDVPAWPAVAGADSPRLPLVLLYHSVSDPSMDPWGVRVSPENFAQQMAVLARHCTPMRLTDLDTAHRSGSLPKRAVAVTFDDGYVDNLLIAKPILERFNVPATVFVSSGYVDRREEYWWDELERLVLQPGWMSRRVSVTIGGITHEWRIGADGFLPWIRWKLQRRRCKYYAYHTAPDETRLHTLRQRMYRPLWEAMRAAPSVEDRERALSSLREQSRPRVKPREANMCVTTSQHRELAGGMIEIGAHTVMHPSIGHFDAAKQRFEIVESKRALEAMLDREISTFAYPFGEHCDYNNDSIAILQQAGYRLACTNAFPREPYPRHVSPYTIPRHIAQDMNGPQFANAMATLFSKYGST